ncbi:MAG: YcxB family protein [Clostridia bacterium]|nr:YcxB family protein [Clostridia bacterium]
MSEKATAQSFQAAFIYSDDVLKDFEALYLKKKETPLSMRIALGVLGGGGAVYFGTRLYREGLQLVYVGYLMVCSLLLVIALSRRKNRPDDSLAKYRKYYKDRRATFRFDDNGVEMHLEGQKNFARSKFREIYGLFDTDLCYYFAIKGRAYYIVPKESITGGTDEEFRRYMQKKCAKRFQHFEL